ANLFCSLPTFTKRVSPKGAASCRISLMVGATNDLSLTTVAASNLSTMDNNHSGPD
ncbi:unnamed protein product, partial [Urochloa humidicola]